MALGVGPRAINIDDLLVPGAQRVSARLLGQIQNFDLNALAPYEAKYLAGLQAQAYDIPLEKAWETARQQMREKTRHGLRKPGQHLAGAQFKHEPGFRR